jgi:hypothetical protein
MERLVVRLEPFGASSYASALVVNGHPLMGPAPIPFQAPVALPAILKLLNSQSDATASFRRLFRDEEQSFLESGLYVLKRGRSFIASPDLLRSIGTQLFNMMLPTDEMRDHFDQVFRYSPEGVNFELRLVGTAPTLAMYAWELIYDDRQPDRGRPATAARLRPVANPDYVEHQSQHGQLAVAAARRSEGPAR